MSFSYAEPFKIYKILPNGKRARAEVSMQEYLSDGWQEQGQTPSTFRELKIADEMLGHKAFRKTVDGVPMDELRKFNDPVRIWLPDDPTHRRSATYGEWYSKYRPLGYQYKYEYRSTPNYWARHIATRRDLEAEVKKRDWWAPTRSYSQASELRRWAFPATDEKPDKVRADTIALQDWKNIPNPKRRSGWTRRTGHEQEDNVVSRKRARQENIPERHGRSDEVLEEERANYDRFWNTRKYPPIWDKWAYS